MTKAVVFAYHNVGVRCLKALLSARVDVPLVVTHRDNPSERIWFDSVAAVCEEYGVPFITPEDANTAEVLAQLRQAQPDFLFSFYYRHMLKAPLLGAATRGAYNLHGSLLPKYRGRVPINWAVIHGETETGATLHVMNEKPDNGAIVDQCAVPILADDTAREVFDKVVVASEIVLVRSLPKLIDGSAVLRPQVLSDGAYFGGRKPEDGRIPAQAGAIEAHNFVRALTAPYPGAYIDVQGQRIVIERTRRAAAAPAIDGSGLRLAAVGGALWLACTDGGALQVTSATLDGEPLDADRLRSAFGTRPLIPDPDIR